MDRFEIVILNTILDTMETCLGDMEACEGFINSLEIAKYKFLKRLKEYMILEEQGKLLKLPCAVGDTVYTLNTLPSGKKVIGETTADAFMCALGMLERRFGKTMFLTAEEAEAALKEWRTGRMRLIDADVLQEHFEKVKKESERLVDVAQIIGIQAVIDSQPTAYDVDRVVQKLEKGIEESVLVTLRAAFKVAIDIVKSGGETSY